ncbi:MAG: hypothetical protein FWE08_08805 [Oscillospiraceae bacterium]|nr:hypothetical protein [Oscillospiraceae bacterium]
MKHRTLKLISLAVICVAAIVTGSIALGQIAETDAYMVEYLADIQDHHGYWVRESEGYLAVYYEGWGHPIFITDIPVITLRGQDREDVEKGIPVTTRRELMELLEDFGS